MTTGRRAEEVNAVQSETGTWRQLPGWVVALILLCCGIELLIVALQLAGWSDARSMATVYGGFWSRLFHDLWPVYPGQQLAMFFSYGVLHGGILHLAMNMVSLAVVARELAKLTGPGVMLLVYLICQIAAAGLFALMAPAAGPMVGASGAVFGLAGALVGLVAIRRRQRGQPMGPLWRAVANIVVLNLGLALLVPAIAWQAHLGGAVAGLALGLWIGRTQPASTRR
ncbi:rhomboid family intramembrane serine protease [uncultured Paracoccus sp.]|uniref:rhomboid family intramembrane serine protease n=1 Tax=uncultured Paracoccus sp. TaxID=189685 RepID=UPI0026303341|nr:rhomboid family intramembrane serine protease [uncultured Paracoccus sp.]